MQDPYLFQTLTASDPQQFLKVAALQSRYYLTQYRSAIFTTNEEQMIAAANTREIYNDELSKLGYGEIVTEIQDAAPHTYWPAEEYHQRYLEKNPNGYDCHSTTGVPFPVVK